MVSDILADLSNPQDNRPKILETTSLLDDMSIKHHFSVGIMCHITELGLQVFSLGLLNHNSLDSGRIQTSNLITMMTKEKEGASELLAHRTMVKKIKLCTEQLG